MDRVDIAIIGSGPAGISAAVNAKIRNKSFLLFGRKELSHKVNISKEIRNYIGFPSVSGKELNERFAAHLRDMEIEITEETITGIYNMGKYFMLLADQKVFEATTVIIAIGAETVKPLPGERELLGKGVSYCATCDGNLFKGKTIAVFCDNESHEHEVNYLAELAKKVYYFPNFASTLSMPNVENTKSKIAKILGNSCVSDIELKDGTKITVDGVFFLKQAVAADVLLGKLETEGGHIVTDRRMQTNIKGCFACGDCTGAPYQIAKSVGEGNIALHSAISYLAEMGKKDDEFEDK
nr:NAD(P)/FAD-dependent oxidoreductase [Lachnospiraceae bacterium]